MYMYCSASGPPRFRITAASDLSFVVYVSITQLALPRHTFMMDISWPVSKLLDRLSEENYDRTLSAYRFWIELGVAHGGVSTQELYHYILSYTKLHPITIPYLKQIYKPPTYPGDSGSYKNVVYGRLIHSNAHLLLRFISDAELDPALSTYAIGLHDRLCRESLEQFFRQSLDYIGLTEPTPEQLCEFYTRVNFIAHWVNLGYVKLEDVRDHILQSLALQPTVHLYQLSSLVILLKISGATFAAYVEPEVMDRCCDLIKPSNLQDKWALNEFAEVRALLKNKDNL